MVGSLSDFFRTSLNRGREIVTVREDLQHVCSYLEIQKIRYMDILEYEILVPEELNDYRIPKITLQPLVENALYHGITNKRGGGKITLQGREKGLAGQAGLAGLAEKAPQESELYGLYNVNERIRLNFGDEYGIKITSEYGKGTMVEVRLPKILTEIVENPTSEKTK